MFPCSSTQTHLGTFSVSEETTRQEEKPRGHDKSLLWHIITESSWHVTSFLSQVSNNKRRKKTSKQIKKGDKSIWYWHFTDHGATCSPPRRSPHFTSMTTSGVEEGNPNAHDRDDDTWNTHAHTHMHTLAVLFVCLLFVFASIHIAGMATKWTKCRGGKKKGFWPCTLTTRDYVQCNDMQRPKNTNKSQGFASKKGKRATPLSTHKNEKKKKDKKLVKTWKGGWLWRSETREAKRKTNKKKKTERETLRT